MCLSMRRLPFENLFDGPSFGPIEERREPRLELENKAVFEKAEILGPEDFRIVHRIGRNVP